MDELIIVIDTREQTPFFKHLPKGVIVVKDKLDAGDYSIKGFENQIAVERKNPDDFLSSVTQDAERFKKEINRLQSYERKILVVEDTYENILARCNPDMKTRKKIVNTRTGIRAITDYSKRDIHPNVVKGVVTSLIFKYGLSIYFALNRKDAEEFTLNGLRKYFREKRG